ncbi:hypothetical protein BU198_22540, partial [Streptomyces sp. CBMA156]|nr:hypothetical protein [Streptomyces sp. CBMA156]
MRLIGKSGARSAAAVEADTDAWAESAETPGSRPGALPAQRTSGLSERPPTPGYGPDSLVHVPTRQFAAAVGAYGEDSGGQPAAGTAIDPAGLDSTSFESALAARESAALEARHRQAADSGDPDAAGRLGTL